MFSWKVSRGEINEGGDSVMDAEGKDWGSLDLPVGKDGTKLKGVKTKRREKES